MRNTCESFAELLDPFIDGELSPEEEAEVRAHLKECPACLQYVEDALAIRDAFPTVEEVEVPADFTAHVMDAVRASAPPAVVPAAGAKQKQTRRKKSMRPWLPMAACFAVILLAAQAVLPLRGANSEAPNAESASMDTTRQYAADEAHSEEEETMLEESSQSPSYATDAQGENGTDGQSAEAPSDCESAEEQEAAVPHPSAVPRTSASSDTVTPFAAASIEDGAVQLTLTAEEAGDLLDGFTPVEETAACRVYALTQSAFQTLCEELADTGVTPPDATDSTQSTVFVAVQN